ncbi:MAG: hypothetical protein GOV00_00730 [Candidatus Altiarchaeota archaeon]|nr:hypothetical protein [Candidatus Altiarchaeota archaeon]
MDAFKPVKLVVLDFDGVFFGHGVGDNYYTQAFEYISKKKGVNPLKRIGAAAYKRAVQLTAKVFSELRPNLPTFMMSDFFFRGLTETESYEVLEKGNVLQKNLDGLSSLKAILETKYFEADLKFVCITYGPKQPVENLFNREGLDYVDVFAPEFEFENGSIVTFKYRDFLKNKKELAASYIETLEEQGFEVEGILSIGDRKQDIIYDKHIDVSERNKAIDSLYLCSV